MKVDKRELLARAEEVEETLAKAGAQLADLRASIARADLPDQLERPSWTCDRCGVSVVNEARLREHLKNVHGVDE